MVTSAKLAVTCTGLLPPWRGRGGGATIRIHLPEDPTHPILAQLGPI